MYLIKNRTHYANDTDSKVIAYTKPDELVKFAKEHGHKVCGICDYGNISGVINFIDACKKEEIKPVVCCEMLLGGTNCIFIALNTDGWLNLIKLNSIFEDKGDISIALFSAYSEHIALILSEHKDLSMLSNKIYVEGGESTYPRLNTFDSRYLYKNDLDDYRLVTACTHNIKLKDVEIDGDYCLENCPNEDDTKANWDELLECVDSYKVLNKPRLPKFFDGNELELVTEKCREGWRQKKDKIPKDKYGVYAERIKMELSVIEEANLAGYFLIVQDFVNYCKDRGILIGPARGSAGGCFISFLLNIISLDPIKYDLLFSRFYNKGRNTGDHIEYPDIDIDFPVKHRKTVIDYIKERYGEDRVAQVITFGSLSGRGALKEVLRAHNVMDPKSIDEVTAKLPQDADISDKLADGGYTSIIEWTLDHEPDVISEWCRKKDGEYIGELAPYFRQAARIEGTYKSTGKHAAGIVIGHTTLSDVYPMCKEKKGDDWIVALEMNDLAKAGGVKFDILGIAALDKLMYVNRLLREGNISEEV